jgi:hypothetical protein
MSIGFEPDTFVYLKDRLRNLNKRWAVFAGLVLLLIVVGLGSSAVLRPVIVLQSDKTGIFVRNTGGLDAIIQKVDGFWYWSGRVAFIANMPSIHQKVASEAGLARLDIPNIPVPEGYAAQRKPFYMRLRVRYIIPGMPMFRYMEQLFFEYDPDLNRWIATENIPLRYRSLGRLTLGDVEPIELDFH